MKQSVALVPSPDVAAILHNLLDQYERRQDPHARVIRCDLEGIELPGYYSQLDPEPRQVANEQFRRLEEAGLVRLGWLPGQEGHLLEAVVLDPDGAAEVFRIAGRDPVAARRARLRDLLLGDRFRLDGWRLRAVNRTLAQLKEERSPAPFSLTNEGRNRDLLAALVALGEVTEETPIRAFSVRTFNDSKRFDALRGAVVRLARRHEAEWRDLRAHEVLAELGLVTNPGHLILAGAWRLVDERGVIHELAGFRAVGGHPDAAGGDGAGGERRCGARGVRRKPDAVLRAGAPRAGGAGGALPRRKSVACLPAPAALPGRAGAGGAAAAGVGRPGLWRAEHPGPDAAAGVGAVRALPHGRGDAGSPRPLGAAADAG